MDTTNAVSTKGGRRMNTSTKAALAGIGAGLIALTGISSPAQAAPAPTTPNALSLPDTIRPTDASVSIKLSYVCTGTYNLSGQVHQAGTNVFDVNGGEYTGLYSIGGGIPGTGPSVPAKCTGKKVTHTIILYSHDTYFRQLGFIEAPSIRPGVASLQVRLVEALGVEGEIQGVQVQVK